MNTQLPTIRDRQSGFGLVESLVALVVVSVGMIGIAALYGQGLSASRTALYRTQAVNLASDMADRIRLNRQGAASYGGGAANNNCEPGGVSCAPAQMAAHDLWGTERPQQCRDRAGSCALGHRRPAGDRDLADGGFCA
jgi:type IV pilus modification protein PilV